MAQKIVSKLSAKSIGVDFTAAKTHAQEVFDIIGAATGVKEVQTPYGVNSKLVGNFEATNLITGEVFVSANCFLPSVVNDLVAAQVAEGNPVQFAYRIGTKPSESNVGYEYTVTPLLAAEPLEIINTIRKQIALN